MRGLSGVAGALVAAGRRCVDGVSSRELRAWSAVEGHESVSADRSDRQSTSRCAPALPDSLELRVEPVQSGTRQSCRCGRCGREDRLRVERAYRWRDRRHPFSEDSDGRLCRTGRLRNAGQLGAHAGTLPLRGGALPGAAPRIDRGELEYGSRGVHVQAGVLGKRLQPRGAGSGEPAGRMPRAADSRRMCCGGWCSR